MLGTCVGSGVVSKKLRTALGAALLISTLSACRADNAGGEAVGQRPDRGGMARVTSEQIGATNPGTPIEAGYTKRNLGTRDQLTAGILGTATGDIGSTPNGAASNTLGSDRDVNGRTAVGTPASPTARPQATPSSNVSGQAAPPGAGKAAAGSSR